MKKIVHFNQHNKFLSLVSKKERRVVVTGIGIICPLGTGMKLTWSNLINGACGIVKLEGEGYSKLPCKVAGIIPKKNEGIVSTFLSKSNLKSMAPATALALLTTEEALSDANWKPEDDIGKEETGVAIGMGMIDLQDVCDTNEALKSSYNKVSPFFVPRILPNMAAGHISIKYGFRGPNHSVSTACATGAHSIGDAFRFIRNGDANVMVCGGAEACISPLAIAGFCRLRALSTSFNDNPEASSRPFDEKRDGFVMGEGAAVLVLEELDHALKREAKIYAEILGYGLSGDASHITSPKEDGSGAVLSMKRALNDARLTPDNITFISAHATSTPTGDSIECKAIRKLFANKIDNVAISATKGAHGHLLGAAGNLEAAFTVLSCFHSILPPILNLETPVDSLNFIGSKAQPWQANQRVALKNSFGFGGTNATLCIGQYIS